MIRFRRLALASGLGVAAGCLHGQQIKLEVRDDGVPVAVTVLVQGQPQTIVDPVFASGEPIEFTVPTFSGVMTARLFDMTLVNGLPDDVVGPVTINGGPTSLGTSRLDFSISGSNGYPSNPRVTISAIGAASFGTGTAPALTITNEALRRRTRVAIAVLGDIRGDITAGQIFRIQNGLVNGDSPLFAGEVTGKITAVSYDKTWDDLGGLRAIEEVNLVGLLSGSITAADTENYQVNLPVTYSTIGRVIVRGTFQFPGSRPGGSVFNRLTAITGAVQAPHGTISEIYTFGSIGVQDIQGIPGEQGIEAAITAADGIARIQTRLPNDPNPQWPRIENSVVLVRAQVAANGKVQQPGYVSTAGVSSLTDGSLNLLATEGEIVGDIRATNLTFASPNERAGIFAAQGIRGNVYIDHLVDGADIVSPARIGNVYIGRQLRGSIIANEGEDSRSSSTGQSPCPALGFVEIGFAEETSLPAYALQKTAGFVGSFVFVEGHD